MSQETLPVFASFPLPGQHAALLVNEAHIPSRAELIATALSRHHYHSVDNFKAMITHLYDVDDIAFASHEAVVFALCLVLNQHNHLFADDMRAQLVTFFCQEGYELAYLSPTQIWSAGEKIDNTFNRVSIS